MASLNIGIVGLPNVGKSTLFNALTKKAVSAENFPFCTIDPAVGVVAVPDQRLAQLGVFSHSESVIPTAIEFVDIAGLVEGAAGGEGLGNQFLSHIREVDAIAHVIRIFEDPDVHHVSGRIEPLSDVRAINYELALSDLQTIARRKEGVEKELKRNDETAHIEADLIARLEQALNDGQRAADVPVSEKELPLLKNLHLLTAKPMLYVLNKKGGGHNLDEMNDDRYHELVAHLNAADAHWIVVDAAVENDLKELEPEDKTEFRREYGYADDGIDLLIRAGYELLHLITFFTTGEKETRAWTVRKGALAPEAGAAIHSDFRDKFIRAEVINWKTLLDAGSKAAARESGNIRIEGKEYTVQDGDVMEFRHG